MHVFVSNKNAVLWESIPHLLKYYGLSATHFIHFDYKSSNKFDIKIRDRNMTEISYPSMGMKEAIVLSFYKEDEPIGKDDIVILESYNEHEPEIAENLAENEPEMIKDEPNMSNIQTDQFEKKITQVI